MAITSNTKGFQFSRTVHKRHVLSAMSIEVSFDRAQIRALLKLRESMESQLMKWDNIGLPTELREDYGMFIGQLELLNTILGDIENIDEVEPIWEGTKLMDERIAAKRRAIEAANKPKEEVDDDDEDTTAV